MEDYKIIKKLVKENKLTIENVYDEIRKINKPYSTLTEVIIREHLCNYGGSIKPGNYNGSYKLTGNSSDFSIDIHSTYYNNIFIEDNKIYIISCNGLDKVYGIQIDIISRPSEKILDFIKNKIYNIPFVDGHICVLSESYYWDMCEKLKQRYSYNLFQFYQDKKSNKIILRHNVSDINFTEKIVNQEFKEMVGDMFDRVSHNGTLIYLEYDSTGFLLKQQEELDRKYK